MHQEPSQNFERVQDGEHVFYSIFSRFDYGVVHLAPEQVQELQQWLADHADTIAQDARKP